MIEDPTIKIVEAMKEKNKRRSDVIWSGVSIVGYIWDIIRNLVIVGVVLSIYNSTSEHILVVIISLIIFVYLNTITIGAQLAQTLVKTNIGMYFHASVILKKLGKEQSEDEQEEFEKTGFLMEKVQYKFYLNSVFNFIIFVIALVNLLGAI